MLQNQKHKSRCKRHEALFLLEKILLLISMYYFQLGHEYIQSTIGYLNFHTLKNSKNTVSRALFLKLQVFSTQFFYGTPSFFMPSILMPLFKKIKFLCHRFLCHPLKSLCHNFMPPQEWHKKIGDGIKKKNQWGGYQICDKFKTS